MLIFFSSTQWVGAAWWHMFESLKCLKYEMSHLQYAQAAFLTAKALVTERALETDITQRLEKTVGLRLFPKVIQYLSSLCIDEEPMHWGSFRKGENSVKDSISKEGQLESNMFFSFL